MNDHAEPVADTTPPPPRLTFEGPKAPLFKALHEARKHYTNLSAVGQMAFGDGPKARKHEYAPLDVVVAALEPGWEKAGISVTQPHDGYFLYTVVCVGDSSMTIACELPQWNSSQDLGAILTYFRRYQLKGVFCVADSEDDDASSAPGGQGQSLGRKEPRASQPSGPSGVSAENKAAAFAAGKEAELSRDEFFSFVQKALNKPWDKCTDKDIPLLLKALEAKMVMGGAA